MKKQDEKIAEIVQERLEQFIDGRREREQIRRRVSGSAPKHSSEKLVKESVCSAMSDRAEEIGSLVVAEAMKKLTTIIEHTFKTLGVENSYGDLFERCDFCDLDQLDEFYDAKQLLHNDIVEAVVKFADSVSTKTLASSNSSKE